MKIEYTNESSKNSIRTYYSYDAQGNVMATYKRTILANFQGSGEPGDYTDKFILNEHMIYDASRVGLEQKNRVITTGEVNETTGAINFELGEGISWDVVTQESYDLTYRKLEDKVYELTEHRGNVVEVITDRKLPVDDGSFDLNGNLTSTTPDNVIDYYAANVVSYSDYYPFGALMDDRNGNTGTYRYGYQGSEKDDNIKGEGNSYNTTFRFLDPRLGRWLSIDPKDHLLPWESPYNSMNNSPVLFNDPQGDIVPLIALGLVAVFATAPNYVNDANNAPNSGNPMKDMVAWSGVGTAGVAGVALIAEGGLVTLGKAALEEVVEYGVESLTGVPMITSVFDVFQYISKKGAKQIAHELTVYGRKFAKGTSIRKMKYWAYNVENYGVYAAEKMKSGWSKQQRKDFIYNTKKFGKELAEQHSKGKLTRKQMVGLHYENQLIKKLGGSGSFKSGGIEFDGSFGNFWYEAKAGRFWGDVASKNIDKWKSKFGSYAAEAKRNGKEFQVISQEEIPQEFKTYFEKKGIKYKENYK